MNTAKQILNEVLQHTKHSKNALAKTIGLKRSQNLYDIEGEKIKNISSELSEKIISVFPEIDRNYLLTGNGTLILNDKKSYLEERRDQKNSSVEEPLPYYDIAANAGSADVEVVQGSKQSGIVVSELFKGSKYVIRIAGNSMTPLYPPGGLLGIAPVQMINPGGVYVVESVDGQLWIKRMFYKDDNQESGCFQLISDNNMKHDNGAREGKLFYPDFYLPFDQVNNLFVVTGIFKSNIITIIN